MAMAMAMVSLLLLGRLLAKAMPSEPLLGRQCIPNWRTRWGDRRRLPSLGRLLRAIV
jgi:hypothetical protein